MPLQFRHVAGPEAQPGGSTVIGGGDPAGTHKVYQVMMSINYQMNGWLIGKQKWLFHWDIDLGYYSFSDLRCIYQLSIINYQFYPSIVNCQLVNCDFVNHYQ